MTHCVLDLKIMFLFFFDLKQVCGHAEAKFDICLAGVMSFQANALSSSLRRSVCKIAIFLDVGANVRVAMTHGSLINFAFFSFESKSLCSFKINDPLIRDGGAVSLKSKFNGLGRATRPSIQLPRRKAFTL